MSSDLVVTAAAVLSPLGIGFDAFSQALEKPIPALRPLTLFREGTPPFVGGQVWGFDAPAILGAKGLRNLDRNSCLVMACIERDLAPVISQLKLDEIGLVLGTTYGSFPSLTSFSETFLKEGFRALNPGHFPNLVINSPPSQGNIRFQLTASSTTISTGSPSGLDAIAFAATRIRQGYESAYICGASEELSEALVLGMAQGGALSSDGVIRPFDVQRDGTLPAEGSALFLLEERAHAEARNAPILACVRGWGSCFGGGWEKGPRALPEAGAKAIQLALQHAQMQPEALGFLASTANGSKQRDAAELQALSLALGDQLANIPVVAYSALWGEASSASSALATAAVLADLKRGYLAGTPSSSRPDGPLWLPQTPLPISARRALLFSLSDYGNATAMIFEIPES